MFAENTKVSESRSKAEIDTLLRKWKAESISTGEHLGDGVVVFMLGGICVRFICPMPTEEQAKKHAPHRRGWGPTRSQMDGWLEDERKRRWRALLLTLKAKLVSVENGIESFERAFLAHIVIPGTGLTVGDRVLPALAESTKSGSAVGMLGSGA